MARRLQGKVAIVTGASRGLGQYCAVTHAIEGARVAVVGRSERETNLHLPGNVHVTAGMAKDYGGEALPLICDVSDETAVNAMVAAVLERWGGSISCSTTPPWSGTTRLRRCRPTWSSASCR